MLNKAILSYNNYNIRNYHTRDNCFELAWLHFFNNNFGTQLKFNWATQSASYGTLDTNGHFQNTHIGHTVIQLEPPS